jgi:hypothetical protein
VAGSELSDDRGGENNPFGRLVLVDHVRLAGSPYRGLAGQVGRKGVHEDFVAGFAGPVAGLAEATCVLEAGLLVGPDIRGVLGKHLEPYRPQVGEVEA